MNKEMLINLARDLVKLCVSQNNRQIGCCNAYVGVPVMVYQDDKVKVTYANSKDELEVRIPSGNPVLGVAQATSTSIDIYRTHGELGRVLDHLRTIAQG